MTIQASPRNINIQACLTILKLEKVESADQIHRAYRRQVKLWHPDQFAHQPAIHSQAEERLKRINQAYSTLQAIIDKKNTCSEKSKTPPNSRAQKENIAKHHKSAKSFDWRKWFKSRQPKTNSQKSENAATIDNNTKCPSQVRDKSRFERILCKATERSTGFRFEVHYGQRPINYRRMQQQKKCMRIKGFEPSSPISPIRPVSRIKKIENSG